MNKVSKLILLFCVCYSANCVQLENLCPADRFEYKLLDVNSFHRIRQNVTFKSISDYLVNDSVKCDPNDFRNHSNYQQAAKLKDE